MTAPAPNRTSPRTAPAWWRRGERPWVLGLLGLFGLSRLAYWLMGVRFDDRTAPVSFQLLDLYELEHHPLRSIWHLHAQPPLYNAYIATSLQLPGDDPRWFYATTFFAVGAAMVVFLYLLMRELGVSALVAAIFTGLFMYTPGAVMVENVLFYTYPVAALLVVAGWALIRSLRTHSTAHMMTFAGALAGVALTRSTYHLLFVLAGVAYLVALVGPQARRRALAAVAIPVMLVVGLYAKNWIVLDSPNASSWLGLNLGKMVFQLEDQDRLRRAVADGEVSDFVLRPPFQEARAFGVHSEPTGVPVRDEARKRNNQVNYNQDGIKQVSDQFLRDARSWIWRHPDRYLERVAYAYRYAAITAEDSLAPENTDEIQPIDDFFDHLLGQWNSDYRLILIQSPEDLAAAAPGPGDVAWVIVAMYALAFATPFVAAFRWIRRRPGDQRVRATLVFIGAVVVYTNVVSNALELLENSRFRFETDPLVCVITAVAVARGLVWVRHRRERQASPARAVGATVPG